jgi:hypothetical protein
MKTVYTYHAKRRMSQRKVTAEQVEEALAWPDNTLPGEQDEEIAIKQFGAREVRIVYYEDLDRDTIVVYTVISKRLRER